MEEKRHMTGWIDDTTAVNCDKIGHCFHPGTTVGSTVCCRCGKLLYPVWSEWFLAGFLLSKVEINNMPAPNNTRT